jgi:hypothetical protein
MPVGFVATEFAAFRENGVLITALGAPSSEEEDCYLMLQHSEKHSEEDIRFGMNQPYIEYCGQGWSWYGHILEFSLHRNSVRVQMDAEAAREMQNDGRIEVTFNLSNGEFQQLRSALRETFTGYAYYQDSTDGLPSRD